MSDPTTTYDLPPPRELKRERRALLEVREERLRDLGLAPADLDVDAAAEGLPQDGGAAGGVDDRDFHLALVDEGEELADKAAQGVVDAADILDVQDQAGNPSRSVDLLAQSLKDFRGRPSVAVEADTPVHGGHIVPCRSAGFKLL